ncbi:uncharacterized protein PgNI_02457 [Pyricularia grisea]|uniref:Uncharacterized protein n=1 Tax=Pyricularia grisea TaxID=148305 RepID=A0A6P8BHT1_PYRGI|nr:uncharacterized protein PgNI_02457 [Pyricularia grisea]TLD16333.1 hypothetical protein PgNI_02457 [Pyricularia grisea]
MRLLQKICNDIFTQLPTSSQMCLSLTGKELYSNYFVKNKDLKGALNVTHNVLQPLEKDLPGYYFCSSCIELHRWKLHEGGSLLSIDQCERKPGTVELQLPSQRHVSYTLDWRSVRIAHLLQMYGEGHECQSALLHEHWEAKFVQGNLLLRTTYTLTSRAVANEPWKEIMNSLLAEGLDYLESSKITLVCFDSPLTSVLLRAAKFDFDLKSVEEGPVSYPRWLEYSASHEIRRIRDAETGGWKIVITAFRNLDLRQKSDQETVVAFSGWDNLEFQADGASLWRNDDASCKD